MSEELKPCPFCNQSLSDVGHHVRKGKVVEIFEHPSFTGCAIDSLIFTEEQWNTRAYEAELAALREENERLREIVQLMYERARHTVDTIEESSAWPFTRETPLVKENERLRNDANPWRYPSRGELPEEGGRWCVVTFNDNSLSPYLYPAFAVRANTRDVRAWKYADDPAPKLEDE